ARREPNSFPTRRSSDLRSIDWNIRIMTFKPTTLSTTTLARAYQVAGVPVPKTLRPSPVLAAIRDLPSVEAVEREIVAALQDVNVKDPNKTAQGLARKHADAVAADQLRRSIGKLTTVASSAVVEAHTDQARTDLYPYFSRRLGDLADAAAALPAGHEANLELIVQVGAAEAFSEAQGALADLSLWHALTRVSGLGGRYSKAADLSVFVDWPETGPAETAGLSGRVVNPDAVRDGVRALDQVARSQGIEAAILRAAAGRVTGVKPSL